MKFDENNESKQYAGHESIFEDSEVADLLAAKSLDVETFDYESLQDNGILSKLINILGAFSSSQENKETKKLQKITDNLFKDSEDIMKLLLEFHCKMIIYDDYIEFSSEKFGITGKITQSAENGLEFDDNAKKILKMIASVIDGVNNADSHLDKNEEEGFYPVGNLEKQTILLNGKETDVLCGTLVNKNGDVKHIYFHNGKEVIPDE